jgi:SAM-dependent methyltransferase
MARDRFSLTPESFVVEIASNDGYLLQYVQSEGIRCLGIEPTASTAQAAIVKGIPTRQEFFGRDLASAIVAAHGHPDLVVANNVIAHVPDIDDFMQGVAYLLSEKGTATFEFPHLLNLIKENQFDTIYHEHFYYYSLTALSRILVKNALSLVDVEELPTHGGSLRVYVQHEGNAGEAAPEVGHMLEKERSEGLFSKAIYADFHVKAELAKNDFLRFLIQAKSEGKKVAGYGAAAKGNTLLNWASVKPDLIEFVVDQSSSKQGKFLPGSRIPIYPMEHLHVEAVDYIVIFPWNLADEISVVLASFFNQVAQAPTIVKALPRIDLLTQSQDSSAKRVSPRLRLGSR